MGDATCLEPDCKDAPTRVGQGRCPWHFWVALKTGVVRKTRHAPLLTCSLQECDKAGWSQDWCRYHYERWIRTGNPRKPAKPTLQDRFWARVDKQDGDGCWLWTGGGTPGNYGIFTQAGKTEGETYAHRVAYKWFVGPIPDGFHVDHQCHNRDPHCKLKDRCPHRRCIRPDHLDACPPATNIQRATGSTDTHCKRGHPYGAATQHGGRWRICPICQRANIDEHLKAQRAQRAESRRAVTHCPQGHDLPDGLPPTRAICATCVQERARPPAKTARREYVYNSHCKNGHEFSPENTYWPPKGPRQCRTCQRANAARYAAKVKASRA